MKPEEARTAILNGTAPENLQVSGGLYLRGCTGLTAKQHTAARAKYKVIG